jgi:hypothetical protein
MTEPIDPSNPDPGEAWRRAQAQAQARDRRQARRYGSYWAVVTALLGVSAVSGLATGNPWGLLALVLGGLSGRYSRYLFRGGRVRIFFLPLP